MKQDRLKSPVVWISVLAQIVIILQVTNVLPKSDIETINVVATAVIQALVLFGILNNPESKDTF